jgi:hypothetical protein
MSDHQTEEKDGFILEEGVRLSHSRLWRLQRAFFEQQGIGAWSQGTVPHYITCNTFIADAYAKVVRAYLAEAARPDDQSPIYIVELGAGSGRFAWYFLKRLLPSPRPLVYVMTDFTDANVSAWREQPQLAALAAEGVLDFARFDAESDRTLQLQVSGRTLSPESPVSPLVVIANYAFDSIVADAFQFKNRQLHECLAVVRSSVNEPDPDDPAILSRVALSYLTRPASIDYYDDPRWNGILRDYLERLDDTAIGFPIGALGACDRLAEIGGGRMLLVTSDKGRVHDTSLRDLGPPGLSSHGSFSLSVNYDAICALFRARGGHAWHPPHQHFSILSCAMVLGDGDFARTRAAYEQAMCEFGPDDWFALKKATEENLSERSVEQILALIRLSRNDPRFAGQCATALFPRAKQIEAEYKVELVHALQTAWAQSFSIEESDDLAFTLGALLLQMGYPGEALPLCMTSLERYGPDPSTLYNIAICHFDLGHVSEALQYTLRTLDQDPEHVHARAMLARLEEQIPEEIP